jgi:hypothetical protein
MSNRSFTNVTINKVSQLSECCLRVFVSIRGDLLSRAVIRGAKLMLTRRAENSILPTRATCAGGLFCLGICGAYRERSKRHGRVNLRFSSHPVVIPNSFEI